MAFLWLILIFGRYPLSTGLLTLLTSYFIYYFIFIVRRPRVYGRMGGVKDRVFKTCPILSQAYWPTFWAWNCHMCTIGRPLMQKTPYLNYERQIVPLPDGGDLALDWGVCTGDKYTPILLILPGLTGNSGLQYVVHFCDDGIKSGYRPVVLNQRGTAGRSLKTPRLFCVPNTEDLEVVLEVIHSTYPKAPIVAVGVSLGALILVHYLSKTGSSGPIHSALIVSSPFDAESTRVSLEETYINHKLYVKFLLGRQLDIVKQNQQMLQENGLDIEDLLQVTKLTEFDSKLIIPMFGYTSTTQYYSTSCITDKISQVAIPLVCVVAADDPFSPQHSFPYSEFQSNPNTLLIVTQHGGHFGFLEGVYPRYKTWLNRFTKQFLEMVRSDFT